MELQQGAKIFLADQRGVQESSRYRSYHTFNFGSYNNEHRLPFGDLYIWNDDTIAAGLSISMKAEKNSCLVLLPVVGAVQYKDSLGNSQLVDTSQLQIVSLPEGASVELINPYKAGLVNFIQVWIEAGPFVGTTIPILIDFDLQRDKDKLLQLFPGRQKDRTTAKNNMSIGKFKGRQEAIYTLQQKNNKLFVFVIEGVFEVQGRLLHARDGLALWNEDEVEFEALSNDAIIILLELASE